jgi:hypothetical protein
LAGANHRSRTSATRTPCGHRRALPASRANGIEADANHRAGAELAGISTRATTCFGGLARAALQRDVHVDKQIAWQTARKQRTAGATIELSARSGDLKGGKGAGRADVTWSWSSRSSRHRRDGQAGAGRAALAGCGDDAADPPADGDLGGHPPQPDWAGALRPRG